jgi:hypothetical protein
MYHRLIRSFRDLITPGYVDGMDPEKLAYCAGRDQGVRYLRGLKRPVKRTPVKT